MEVTTWRENGAVPVTVLQVKGDLTAAEPLVTQSRAAFEDGARNMAIDLSQVNFISSAGLQAIHVIYMMLRSADPREDQAAVSGIVSGDYKSAHLKLVNPTRNGRKALSTAGYDMFLEIYDTISAAVGSFQ
jgi:hypothetical protein